MAENYDLIFGQSASSQYAWSDSDYQNGWQTVGSTPPTAEQFDALQRRSDTKAKDLNNRLSPLETKAEADGRQASTAYTAGTMVTVDGLPNGWLLECVVAGNSGAGAITLPPTLIDGRTIVDGDVTWKLRKVATNGGLGYRQPSTAYAVGQIAYHSALSTKKLVCVHAGTTASGNVTPSTTEGELVTDGTVVWQVDSLADGNYTAAHINGAYRGANITAYFNSGYMSTNIQAGNFVGLYIGDYIIKSVTVNGTAYNNVTWIVMDLDYHLHAGNTETTAHHVVLMPETILGTQAMNATNITTGGYVGSVMWTTHIPKVVTGIEAAFGDTHVLTHKELLSNSVNTSVKSCGYNGLTGAASNWAWTDVKVNLANEPMVYGIRDVSSSSFDVGECTKQLAAFNLNHGLRCSKRQWWWLRAVAYSETFATVGSHGGNAADHRSNDADGGVRPYFLYR